MHTVMAGKHWESPGGEACLCPRARMSKRSSSNETLNEGRKLIYEVSEDPVRGGRGIFKYVPQTSHTTSNWEAIQRADSCAPPNTHLTTLPISEPPPANALVILTLTGLGICILFAGCADHASALQLEVSPLLITRGERRAKAMHLEPRHQSFFRQRPPET